MLRAVNPDQPGEEKLLQGDHDASPNRESIESSEKAQTNKSSEQRSGGTDAESEEKETHDAGTATRVGTSCSSDGGGRAPIASAGAAAPPLQRQMSNYGVQTDEEVRELENMIKAIAPTPRKAKRVYNMYVTSEEELGVFILRHRTVGRLPPMVVLASTLIQLPIRLDLRLKAYHCCLSLSTGTASNAH